MNTYHSNRLLAASGEGDGHYLSVSERVRGGKRAKGLLASFVEVADDVGVGDHELVVF